MFASIQKLAILALFFGLSAAAPAPATASDAIPQVSTEALTAFGLTEDMVTAANITSRDVLEARTVLAARVASCDPPFMPHDATYGACALPLVEAAREGNTIYMLVLAEYLTKHMACPTDGIWGGAARPVTKILAHRCGGPGPEYVDQGAQGWSINSSFNEEPCLPGDKCA
ncbi:uncharacterized protein EAE97_012137 [Botrytis byssoidea]|uniref:Ecp2 effector protein domain-containing protein n=1 Tax=Botrytis byssoidea TaxID=139641 RepID=A0A9P5LNB0_9HELO|nr:uncharacterized protein EAE97_012137 [Botrytis byssoidea]KAF7916259.1 hypothetical protein EAE97_012137 [Botrytis byssoidea]